MGARPGPRDAYSPHHAFMEYPKTRKASVIDDHHGVAVPDPYRWLEDTESAETRAWIDAQNQLTFDHLSRIPARETVRRRLAELWNYVRIGTPAYPVPFVAGERCFYLRGEGLRNQPVLVVQQGLDGEAVPLLDPNALSPDGTLALSSLDATVDGERLAYGVADGGSDWQQIRVLDLESGRALPDRIDWVKFSAPSWTHDGQGFFYSRYPNPGQNGHLLDANRHHRLFYHRLGTDQAEDRLIYERPDEPEWGFHATVSENGRFVLVQAWHGTAPETRLFVVDLGDALAPNLRAPVVALLDRADAAYVPIGVVGERVFMVTDRFAPRKRVVSLDLRTPGADHLREVVPEGPAVLQSAALAGGYLALSYLRDAAAVLEIRTLDGAPVRELPLPTLGSVVGLSGRQSRPELFYAFTSFLHPTTVFVHDLRSAQTAPFHTPDVAFDRTGVVTTQEFFLSKDGTRVPMFVVRKRARPSGGPAPALLYGYGGFNVSLSPFFSVPNLLWLELGGVLAVPNLRGGGEYGEEWHRAGTLERKQNVFDDFIAAAEHLTKERHARPGRIAISGGSNGGLLVAACMTQRPDLFRVALPAVGVMDMLRYHRFTIGWAWVSDYGSADDAEAFTYLRAYSPLHNVKGGVCYPATLVTTADHDDRVVPGHSFKFAARLQEAQGCERPVLIRIDVRAGHGAGKPMTKVIDEAADRLAFAWWHVHADEE